MEVQKIIQRRIRHKSGGISVVGDLNAVVSANVNKGSTSLTHTSSRQRVVQKTSPAEGTERRSSR